MTEINVIESIKTPIKENIRPEMCRILADVEQNTPADPLEKILYFRALGDFCRLLSIQVSTAEQDALSAAQQAGIVETPGWRIVERFAARKQSEIAVSKLVRDYPDIYASSLTMRATDAERILGKDFLKNAVIQEKGKEFFDLNAGLTLGELKKHLPTALWGEYITETYPLEGWDVVKKEAE